MNEWNPRQEIISAAHRWYWIAGSFILGALLGWIVSFIWPAPYRATLDLYVGLNAHRTTRDLYIAEVAQESFENLDDYKHWQMSQLNALVLSDEYLDETLMRLQAVDENWRNFDVPALREILSVAWRNTGEWHFSAQAATPDLSTQAVSVWSEVVLEKTGAAVAAARQLIIVDRELNAVAQELVAAEIRQTLLFETRKKLEAWKTQLENRSNDQPLSSFEHWDLISQVSAVADWSPGWIALLDAVPALGAPPLDYLDWLTQVIALIDAELAGLSSVITALSEEHASLAMAYHSAADQSRALSGNLEVARIKDQLPKVSHLRPVGTLILIGGLFGVLAWMLGWLMQITRKTER